MVLTLAHRSKRRWKSLHDIVKSGKARYLGASTMFAWQFAQMNYVARENGWTSFVNMQCQYNLLYREEEREMLPYCQDQGIAVTCFQPAWPGAGWRLVRISVRKPICGSPKTSAMRWTLKSAREWRTMATERGTTMAEIALAWVCAKEAICCPNHRCRFGEPVGK